MRAPEFNETVHQRTRLRMLAALYEVPQISFVELREILGLTDGNLARHTSVLEDAGLVTVKRTSRAKNDLTYIAISAAGRRAFQEELRALRALVDGVS